MLILIVSEIFFTDEADYDFSVTGAEDMVTFESGTKNAAIKNAIVQIQDDTLVEGTEMIVLLGTLPNVNDQNIASFRQDRDRVNFSILDNDGKYVSIHNFCHVATLTHSCTHSHTHTYIHTHTHTHTLS